MKLTAQPTWRNGLRDVVPVLIGVVPFGLIFGVTAAASDVDQLAAWASSFLLFGGSSQMALIGVMGTGGAAITALITAIILNSRSLMYSADLGRYTSDLPTGLRARMAYLLTDEAYAVTHNRFSDPTQTAGLPSYYFGVALGLWTSWQISTTAGFLLEQVIPQSWRLEFAVPMVFVALIIFSVKAMPGVLAAAVGGGVAVVTMHLDYQLGLVCGTFAGVLTGLLAERWFAS